MSQSYHTSAIATSPVWSLEEMRRADALTISGIVAAEVGASEALGAESVDDDAARVRGSFVLMRRAGEAVAAEVVGLLGEGEAAGWCGEARGRVGVLVGPGNNGGDGLVVARVLRERGVPVRVVVAESPRCSPEVACAAAEWLATGGETFVVPSGVEWTPRGSQSAGEPAAGPWYVGHAQKVGSDDEIDELLLGCSVLVDGLLGIGQSGAVRGAVERLVAAVSRRQRSNREVGFAGVDELSRGGVGATGAVVIAVDVPTGVCAESGRVFEPFIAAHYTIAVQGVKRGCLLAPAYQVCGTLRAVEVGIAGDEPPCGVMVLRAEGRVLRRRAPDSHKFGLGNVVVVGGSLGMPGAPALAAEAALRAGAGLVVQCRTAAVDESVIRPEVMRAVVGTGGCFAAEHLSAVMTALARASAVIVGPGIGRAGETVVFLGEFLAQLREQYPLLPVIIDADALSIIAEADKTGGFPAGQKPWIMTPHHGEAARLLGRSVAEVIEAPFAAAGEIARRFGVVCVLKGAGTIVATERAYRVIPPASIGLATAGSGDVLAGIIGGFVAQWGAARSRDEQRSIGESVWSALPQCAVEGVVAHGLAARRFEGRGFVAREVAAAVSEIVVPVIDQRFVAPSIGGAEDVFKRDTVTRNTSE